MSRVSESVREHARKRPGAAAVEGNGLTLTYAELEAEVRQVSDWIRESRVRTLGLALENGPAWAVWDLAAQRAGAVAVALPGFFTPHQIHHTLTDAGVEAVVTPASGVAELTVARQPCRWERLQTHRLRTPPETAKVTYTSGTTGRPKGVCLSQAGIDRVVGALIDTAQASVGDRHLALLPLSVLLENIGGLYVPLCAGATAVLEPSHEVGISGSSQLDPQRTLQVLVRKRATTAITVPGQLEALTCALESGAPLPEALRFVAVGGGTVSPRLIRRARTAGMPVYQGYGLSECASVVALNRPGDDDPASVGRPLPHTDVKIAEDGEVLVHAPGFLGYLGAGGAESGWWATGDIGYLDAEGRLHIRGRKRNVFITAFGRNVNPEWVEAELAAESALRQVAVFGEARPWNSALVVSPASDEEIAAAILRANRRLPDYARVRRWLRAESPFLPENGMATDNGRLRREVVFAAYRSRLDSPEHTKEIAP